MVSEASTKIRLRSEGTSGSRERVIVMAHVQDVAASILRTLDPMTAMKLQKLCYYAYGYHLAWEDRQLFPERFEAWANGPVCRELYDRHRGRFQLTRGDIRALRGDPDALDHGEAESLDLVLSSYGELTAHQLSLLTHREEPWLAARRRAGLAPMDRGSEELSDIDIYEHFDALTAAAADGAAAG